MTTNEDSFYLRRLTNYFKHSGSIATYILSPVSNHFLDTKFDLDDIDCFNYVLKYRKALANKVIDHLRKLYNVPKSYQHDWTDEELTLVPLEKIIGNSSTK